MAYFLSILAFFSSFCFADDVVDYEATGCDEVICRNEDNISLAPGFESLIERLPINIDSQPLPVSPPVISSAPAATPRDTPSIVGSGRAPSGGSRSPETAPVNGGNEATSETRSNSASGSGRIPASPAVGSANINPSPFHTANPNINGNSKVIDGFIYSDDKSQGNSNHSSNSSLPGSDDLSVGSNANSRVNRNNRNARNPAQAAGSSNAPTPFSGEPGSGIDDTPPEVEVGGVFDMNDRMWTGFHGEKAGNSKTGLGFNGINNHNSRLPKQVNLDKQSTTTSDNLAKLTRMIASMDQMNSKNTSIFHTICMEYQKYAESNDIENGENHCPK